MLWHVLVPLHLTYKHKPVLSINWLNFKFPFRWFEENVRPGDKVIKFSFSLSRNVIQNKLVYSRLGKLYQAIAIGNTEEGYEPTPGVGPL